MKILEISDFHYDSVYADELLNCFPNIETAAKQADLVVIPGDFFNRPLYATNGSRFNEINKALNMLSLSAPIVAIEGTPSHDGPGCYDSLTAVKVLKPGNVYCYKKGEIYFNEYIDNPEIMLFGIPELKKGHYLSKNSENSEQSNASLVNLFDKYVAEFIGPRTLNINIPSVCLFHGNVSDAKKENTDDIILRSSDIIIHTEIMEKANITRWSLGHIHTPWESEKIFAGYAGFSGLDRNPWGKTGFIPAMNLVDLETKKIERIPYGTPKRIKIYEPLSSYEKNIAYWLESKNPDDKIPDGHEWSRITYNIEKNVSRRVDDVSQLKTLTDIFKKFDPKITKNQIEKVGLIESNVIKKDLVEKNVIVKSVRIKGCKFFKKAQNSDELFFDLENYPNELIAVTGENGSGKSSLLSFCSPYPILIGKDTSSGRKSAIKEFFNKGSIEKIIKFNGKEHRHLINLTKTKCECFLFVDDKDVLTVNTFDAMFEMTEKLYGPFQDYLSTSFYIQPLQSKLSSSLMSATMNEIRDLVLNIAGIDRSNEKRFALDKISEYEKMISNIEVWLEASKMLNANPEEIKNNIVIFENELKVLKKELETITIEGKKISNELEIAKSNSEIERKKQKDLIVQKEEIAKAEKTKDKIKDYEEKIKNYDTLLLQKKENEIRLKEHEKAIEKYNNDIKIEREAFDEKSKKINNERKKERELFDNKIKKFNVYNEEHDKYKKMLFEKSLYKSMNKPCTNCGFIDLEIKAKMEEIKNNNDFEMKEPEKVENPGAYISMIADVGFFVPSLASPKKPELHNINDLDMMQEYKVKIAELKGQIQNINYELITINEDVFNIESGLQLEYNQLQKNYTEKKSNIDVKENEIKNENKILNGLLEKQLEIEKKKEEKKSLEIDLIDWKYISQNLQSNKIPAFELDIIANSIDSEATRLISHYRDNRYIFETQTQINGIDKFNILIHDNEKGTSFGFTENSPGEKAFFNDAYVKALIKKRNEQNKTNYSPLILDEADAPIQPHSISSYYEIQKDFFLDKKVLIVSQKPDAYNYIQNEVNIKELVNVNKM